MLNVLDPQNTDEAFLTVAHGVIGYDVVNDVDLKLGKLLARSGRADDLAIADSSAWRENPAPSTVPAEEAAPSTAPAEEDSRR